MKNITRNFLITGTPLSGKKALLKGCGLKLNKTTKKWENPEKSILIKSEKHTQEKEAFDIIIAVDISTIEQQKENQKKIDALWQTLVETQQNTNKKPSIHLIITQCDKIPSFSPVFSKQDEKIKLSPFGINIKRQKNQKDDFDTKYNKLINNILSLTESHPTQTADNKNILLQMMLIKKNLEKLLVSAKKNRLSFDNIFFTSNKNKGKSLFTENLLENLSSPGGGLTFQNNNPNIWTSTLSFASYGLTAFIIILSLVFWQHSFKMTQLRINQVLATLNKPIVVTSKNSEEDMFNRLNALRLAQPLLKKSDSWLSEKHTDSAYKKTSKTYQKLINATFIPFLNKALTDSITNNLKNPRALYPALKAYLTLNQYQYFDTSSITKWFTNYWQNKYTSGEQLDLQKNLQYILTEEKYKNYSIDTKLIKQARKSLASIPFAQLGVIILENNSKDTPLNLPYANDPESGFTITQSSVPAIYTKPDFQETLSTLIPAAAQQLENKDWVSDVKVSQSSNNEAQIKTAYLENYSKVWGDVLAGITLTPATSIKDVLQKISLITNQQSSLWQLLRIATYNTVADNSMPSMKTYITPNFIELSAMQQQSNDSLNNTLNNLTSFLDTLNSQANPNEQAYSILAKNIMQEIPISAIADIKNIAKNQPAPINLWMTEISKNSTKALLDMASDYLNDLWTSDVVPTYKQNLRGKFPIFKESDDNISLKDFNNFFQPDGIIDTFFTYYLKPFVDVSKPYWVWKKIDGQTLTIDQKNLDDFIRASLIKKIFYQTQAQSPELNFDILPLNFAKDNLPFELTLNGTTHYFKPRAAAKKISLQWPFQQDMTVTLAIKNPPPEDKTIITQDGPWGFFRLLDQASIINTSNPSEFKVLFEQSNSKTSAFLILLPSPINPFVPGIIDQFRCPDTLK